MKQPFGTKSGKFRIEVYANGYVELIGPEDEDIWVLRHEDLPHLAAVIAAAVEHLKGEK